MIELISKIHVFNLKHEEVKWKVKSYTEVIL